MREWTETRREGTDVGPVDWTHPHVKEVAERHVPEDILREVEAHPSEWLVSNYGGWPRIWHRVIRVCMYDGWPYWQPGPACLVEGTLGPEWYWFNSLTGACRATPRAAPPPPPHEAAAHKEK